MDIMSALKKVTTDIRDWTNNTKADKNIVDSMSTNMNVMSEKLDGIPNDLVIIEGKLYLAQDGTPLDDTAVQLPEGGGGGSGPSQSITLTISVPNSTIPLIHASSSVLLHIV